MEALTPYASPYLPAFDAGSFKEAVRLWRAPPSPHALVEPPWTFFHCPTDAAYRLERRPWQPKLYVCVGPRDYWRCIRKLLKVFGPTATRWKFFSVEAEPWPAGYGRPDKIVFYPPSAKALAALVSRLRPLLAGYSHHAMRHAAPAGPGLWLGCDPMFLGNASWRVYRTLVFAFGEKNRGYLEGLRGGYAGWARRMNLSLDHEGPASMDPPAADHAYIRRYWRLIYPS